MSVPSAKLAPRVALFTCWLLAIPAVAEADTPRPLTRGLAVLAGAGHQYAGLGVQAQYLVPLPGRLTVASSIALGGIFGPPEEVREIDDGAAEVFGFSAGISGSWGFRHRLALDLGVGLSHSLMVPVQDTVIDAIPVYGAYLQGGYEFLASSGFLLRVSPLGFGRALSGLMPESKRWFLAASLGLGWKLW